MIEHGDLGCDRHRMWFGKFTVPVPSDAPVASTGRLEHGARRDARRDRLRARRKAS
jgi:hypothetical protein